MMGKREPWMIRAVAGSLFILAMLGLYSLGVAWLYDKVADITPDWMQRRGWGRWQGFSILETLAMLVWAVGGLALAAAVGVKLFQLLKVPFEAFLPGGSEPDYPRKRHLPRGRDEMN